MVWHIFRKDWKLLWPMALGVALLNITDRHTRVLIRDFLDPRSPLHEFEPALWLLSLFSMAILIGMAVHQDVIPGLRQDWLVRPIKRRDLLLSKLLFAVLAVQAPLFVDEVVRGLRLGVPIGPALTTALASSLWMLLALGLPSLALGAITRNLAEMAGAVLMAMVSVALVWMSAPKFYLLSTFRTSISWVNDWLQVLCGVAGVAVVLTLQYTWRRTTPARLAFGATVVIALLTQLLPWQQAFAIQRQFSARPSAAEPVRINFEPAIGKWPGRLDAAGRLQRSAVLYIPVRIDGVAKGLMLMTDRVAARFVNDAVDLPAWAESGRGKAGAGYQLITVHEDTYKDLADQTFRLELDYSLTLLKAEPARVMANSTTRHWIPNVGSCAAEAAAEGKGLNVNCVPPGHMPCVDWFVQDHEQPGFCVPDYAPFAAGIGGAYGSRSYQRLPSVSSVDQARINAVLYEPEAHFTRRVVIDNLRMSDWRAE